jgi:hypothetical protein
VFGELRSLLRGEHGEHCLHELDAILGQLPEHITHLAHLARYGAIASADPVRFRSCDSGQTPSPSDAGQSTSWMTKEVWGFLSQFWGIAAQSEAGRGARNRYNLARGALASGSLKPAIHPHRNGMI